MCMPVIRALRARGHEVTVLALTVAGPVLERAGIAHTRPIDYVNYPAVEAYGARLATRHHTEGKGLSLQESIAYLGVSFQNLADEIGEAAAWQAYEEKGLNAFTPVAFMKEVLQREMPDMVIATPSPRMEKAALQAAHALGIPSLCMVDLFAILEIDWLARPDNGDQLTVYSEKIRKRLIAAGRRPEDIAITGNPAFDALAPYKGADGTAYRAARGIAPDKKIILWAEQPEPLDPELPRRVRQHLHQLCARHPEYQLVVRLHPSSSDPAKEIIPEGALQSHAQDSLQEAIASADMVVTLTSTVGMEALLLDKPTMIIAISPYQHLVDYTEEDGAYVAASLEEAEAGIACLLEEHPKAMQLKENRKKLPAVGDATHKIVALIEQCPAWRA